MRKNIKPLKVAGLFSGIGGFEVGLENAGFTTSLLCEIDPVAQEVLKTRFPGVDIIDDIKSIKKLPNDISVVCAGFPCQNLSSVGQKEGIDGSKSVLINELFRILRNNRAEWTIIENVEFMLHLGSGRAIDTITSALEKLNYSWAYRIINSEAFGVPQRRKRFYLVASINNDPRSVLLSDDVQDEREEQNNFKIPIGFYWTEGTYAVGLAINSIPPLKAGSTIGIASPPAILFPDGRIVTPEIRDAERLQGFSSDWTKPAENVAKAGFRWRLVGNAVTTNIPKWLGEKILTPSNYNDGGDTPLIKNKSWPKSAWSIKGKRFKSSVSDHPIMLDKKGIGDFLNYEGKPLSTKAAKGFLSRAEAGTLRFPKGFLDAVRKYASNGGH